MSTVIYEFNARNASPADPWDTNPANMVNGTETDYAETDSGGDEEELTANECVGTDLGDISKVEIRAYGYGDADDELILTPVFGGSSDGDDHTEVLGAGAGWNAWQDISGDTNSPGFKDAYTTQDDDKTIYAATWYAQTFTTGSAYDIVGVKLSLYRVGTPETVTVSIRAVVDGLPAGDDLCSGTTDGDTLTTSSSGEWRVITFASPTSLSDATLYAIVVRAPDGTSSIDSLSWRLDTNAGYADGQAANSSNSGVDWAAVSARDCTFVTLTSWDWSDVQDLDCDVEYNNSGKANTMYVGMVQAQVTYTAEAPPAAVGYGIVV